MASIDPVAVGWSLRHAIVFEANGGIQRARCTMMLTIVENLDSLGIRGHVATIASEDRNPSVGQSSAFALGRDEIATRSAQSGRRRYFHAAGTTTLLSVYGMQRIRLH